MKINLNNLNKKLLTKNEILKHIDDWSIYQYYSDFPLEINKLTNSPLRTDNKPSFALFIGDSSEICFKDFNLSSGDCIKFVQLKYNLNYYEALSKIAIDFDLGNDYILKRNEDTDYNLAKPEKTLIYKNKEQIIKELNTYKLGKSSRNWELRDLLFWKKYAISKKTLELYNVSPLSHIIIGDKIIKCKDLAYSYTEYKDGKETYKIYQPNNKDYKWLNNHNFSVWQGWSQLPINGDILIITKSLKDVMSIRDVTGIPSVALQTENSKPKDKVIDELKQRFNLIFVLYDNDFDKETNWGKIYSDEICKNYNFIQLEIPLNYTAKDFSDFVELYGQEKAKKFLLKLCSEHIPF
jgi:hypothetical protein